MFGVILGVSAVALAFGTYHKGIAKGRAEGEGMRRALEKENHHLRFGGSMRDPFLATDRLTGDRSARRIYGR